MHNNNSLSDDQWATGETGFLFEEYAFSDSDEKVENIKDIVNKCVHLTSTKEEKLKKLREMRENHIESLKLIEKAITLIEQEKK